MSPKTAETVDAMKARYLATGRVNPQPGTPEAKSENRSWWRSFWASQLRSREGRQ